MGSWDAKAVIASKFVSYFLIALFFLSPVGSAYAQLIKITSWKENGIETIYDNHPENPAPQQQLTTPPPAPPAEQTETPADTSAPADSQVPTDEQPAPDSLPLQTESFGTDGAPTISGNNIFTFQSIQPKAEGETGALTQRIKLDIPPGRNGLQPNLALEYNSQRTEDSIVGYGWSVSIPYIERLNKTGSQDLYGARPYFTSSIDGELATSSNATTSIPYGAKIENGQFNSYTYSSTSTTWTMYDKNGTRYLFGASDQSRQNATTSTSTIYKWMLEEIRDPNNNYVKFTYNKDYNQIYPYQIVYTGNGVTNGIFTIAFATSTRPDQYISYKTGFKVTTNYRISKITASISGTSVREYNLSYTTGNNGYRSLLSAVQQNGYDAAHTLVALPALSFGYVSTSTAFVAPSGDSTTVRGPAWVVSDVQGNSLNDITVFYKDPVSGNFGGLVDYDQAGTASPAPPSNEYWATNSNGYDGHPPVERGVRFLDVNADGKADVVRGYWDYTNSTSTNALYLNNYATSTGYSWVSTTTWTGTFPYIDYDGSGSIHNLSTGIFGDVNGDGLPDYERRVDTVGDLSGAAFLGNGTAWDATTTIFGPAASMPLAAPTPTNSQLIDINGDGLSDWVSSDDTTTYVQLNNGTGWTSSDPHWTIATSTLYKSPSPGPTTYYDRGARFLDINGDGLPDFVRAYKTASYTGTPGVPDTEVADVKVVLLNTGVGWATSTAYGLSTYIGIGELGGCSPCTFVGVIDNNEYANWTGNGQQYQDVIQTITYPQGGTSTILYSKTGQQSSKNPELPISLLTVASITNSDGINTSARKDYSYAGGKMYLTRGVRDRKFANFASSTETTPSTITSTYFNQGDFTNKSLGEQSDGWGQVGRMYRQDVIDPTTSQPVQKTFNRWDTATTSSGTFVYLAREMKQTFGVGGAHRDTATDYTYSTSTGNVTQIKRYGEVTGSSDGTFSDTGSDIASSSISYAASTTAHIWGLPATETTQDQSSNKVKETRHYYDGLTLGNVNIGNETKTENWITSSTYASTTKTYDGTYGLVTQSKDEKSSTTTYTLDANNLYPATSTNALSHATGYKYDYSTGKACSVFDANSRLSTTTFDGLGRTVAIGVPDPSSGSLVTKTTYAYTDSATPGATSVLQTDYLNSATTSKTYSYVDGLGRNLQQRKQAEAPNTYAVKDWTYNNLDLLNSESLPYFAVGSSRTSATTTTALFTTYAYEALRRIASIVNAVGTTTNAYASWTTTTTDANGKVKGYTKDAYGNLASVAEYISATTSTTTYAWNLNSNLTKITDGLGNIRNFTYNGLGDRLTAEDLHAPADGTFGSWSYTYDPARNMTQRVDPKSQTVNIAYDILSRPLTEDYTGQSGTEVTYAYDTCTDGKTRLCSAATASATTSYAYNPLGLAKIATSTISNTDYVTQYGYDRQSNLTSLTYPDNSAVLYTYNSAGLPEVISRKKPGGSTYIDAITNLNYGPTGAITLKSFGNGVTTQYTYDPNQLYRLINILTLPIATSTAVGGNLGLAGMRNLAVEDVEVPLAKATSQWLALAMGADIGLSPGTALAPTVPVTESTSTNPYLETSDSYSIAMEQELSGAGKATVELKKARPEVRFKKWNGNVDIGVSYNKISASGVRAPLTDRIEWKSVDEEVHTYPLKAKAGMEDGGFEIELKLNARPASNTFSFAVDGAENFDFFYQAPLNQEKQGDEVASCTETQCVDGKGVVVVERPENVVGSYAVYHKTRRDYELGKVNYGVGKVFQIYRPKAVDAAGHETWGTLAYKNGTLTVALPQQFLDTATYPVTVDPTFGLTSQGATGVAFGSFDVFTGGNASTTENGSVISVSYLASGLGGYTKSIITDSSRIILANGVSDPKTTSSTTAAWITSQFSGALPKVSGSQTYYLGVVPFNISLATYYYDTVTGFSRLRDTTNSYTSPTNPSDGTLTSNQRVSVYATYVPDATSSTASGAIQNISYGHDSVGNIITLTDNSGTGAGKALYYSYDDLHRLTDASTLSASSSPFHEAYTYNAIGNMLTKSTSTSASSNLSLDLESSSNQYAYHADAVPFGISGDWTIEAWMKPESFTAGGSTIASKVAELGSGQNNAYALYVASSTGVGVIVRQQGFEVAVPTIATSSWTHIAAVFDSSTKKAEIFINGASVATTSAFTNVPDSNTAPFRVGMYRGTTENPFDGLIDDVRLWNAMRTGAQISANKNVQLTGSETNLAAYYKLDNSYTDSTANANNLTAVNGPVFSSDSPFSSSTTPATYTYAGTGNANPHAVTQIADGHATTTLGYDNDGNLLTSKLQGGATSTYSWDYRNRLTQITNGISTSTYAYDHTDQRVKQTVGSTTTIYPNKYFSVTGATTTASIYVGDTLIATIEGNGVATSTSYIHPDHLGSTNVVTNASGSPTQILDFYPYGSQRIASSTYPTNEKHKYIGQYFDDATSLSYLNARYMDPSRGAFLSEEPIFLNIGDANQVRQLSKQDQQAYLTDPQALNSYSYGRGNPIARKDTDGRNPLLVVGAGLGAVYGVGQQLQYDLGRGQSSSVPTYVGAGLKGVGQGVLVSGSLVYAGPVTVLEGYGYYQTYQGARDFYRQLLANPQNYTEQQRRMTAGQLWLDAVQRIASAFTLQPAKAGYDATVSILNSLLQLSQLYSSTQSTGVSNQIGNRPSSQGGGAALPPVVAQNGVTYVRNASGLLNIAN